MKEQKVKLWTGQFVTIVLTTFIFFLCLMSLTAGFPVFETALTGSSSKGGFMTTFFMLGAILTRPFIGVLVHKIDIKVTMLFTLTFVIVTLFLSIGRESFTLLVIIRIFQGVSFGIITTLLATVATQILPQKRFGEGIGYFGMATSLGTSLAPMLALTLIHATSFNGLLLVTIGFAIICFIGSFFVRDTHAMTAIDSHQIKGSLVSYMFDKKAFLPTFLVMLFYITFGGIVNFIDGLGHEAHIEDHISSFFLVTAIAMIVIRPFSGRIFDRLGHKFLILPAAVFGLIGLFLLSITESTLLLVVAAGFYGLAYGVIQPTLQAWAVSRVSADKKGTANAMTLSCMDLGMAIGAASLGTVADKMNFHKMFGASSVLIVLLIVIYAIYTFGRARKAHMQAQEEAV
ncbi:MFS transporter [Pullulanibacillus camelliae]|uniref:MFS transporter n=1 Tax=Pullulanibacillus camelliae TaxID=1707096 RepID=A0A8J2VT47_9BACL|nr:MFS transporter [Pullulanibacillus camelliae]GGE37652.1 MFS transporter [Pullulanibacillus camelliae]